MPLLQERGFIYKGSYTGQYCVFDELYVEAPPGAPCPDCGRPTETLSEENYFFKLSAFERPLLEYYESHPESLLPETRRNEVIAFLKSGLRDLSVSRTSYNWGIPVPGDEKHVIYVWFDALSNYITALGWGSSDDEKYKKFWPADLHLVGKEIIRFHCVYWPAFLLAAGLPLPKSVHAHGWLLFEESKMSKSRGNIVRSETILDAFGALKPELPKAQQDLFAADALRYFLLREIVFGQDGSFSFDALVQRYNSDLANGYGNLVSRTLSMIGRYFDGLVPMPATGGGAVPRAGALRSQITTALAGFSTHFDAYDFSRALEAAWALVAEVDGFLTATAPWKKDDDVTEEQQQAYRSTILYIAAESIRIITALVYPVIPSSAATVWAQLGLGDITQADLKNLQWGGLKPGTKLGELTPLFPRADQEVISRMNELEQKNTPPPAAAPEPSASAPTALAPLSRKGSRAPGAAHLQTPLPRRRPRRRHGRVHHRNLRRCRARKSHRGNRPRNRRPAERGGEKLALPNPCDHRRSGNRPGNRCQRKNLHRRLLQSRAARRPDQSRRARPQSRQASPPRSRPRHRNSPDPRRHRRSLHARVAHRTQGRHRRQSRPPQASRPGIQRHDRRCLHRRRPPCARRLPRRRPHRRPLEVVPMIDSHAHLDSPRYDEDRPALLERAWAAGVRQILSIGIGEGPDTMHQALEISRAFAGRPGIPKIWASAGIHPHEARLADEPAYSKLEHLLTQPEVLACGEIGLDYFYDHSPRETQHTVFTRQMEIAAAHKKPIIIHCRPSLNSTDAWDDTLEMLEREWARTGLGGILHCFSGQWRHARQGMDLGFLISFAGNITFPKAQEIRDIAAIVPLDRMLIETDAPFLAPIPNRGKRNEPAWVKEVAVKIAELCNLSPEDVAARTAETFGTFFRTQIDASNRLSAPKRII